VSFDHTEAFWTFHTMDETLPGMQGHFCVMELVIFETSSPTHLIVTSHRQLLIILVILFIHSFINPVNQGTLI
jgi:hypothetical protein